MEQNQANSVCSFYVFGAEETPFRSRPAAFLPRLRGPTNHKATSKVNCVMEKGISRIQSENQSITPPSTSELTPT